MNNAQQTPLEAGQTGEENIPQNASFRESSRPETPKSGHIVEVTFDGSNHRNRESFSLPPRRVPNAQRRSREFLTDVEVEKLIAVAEKVGRHGHRDATMLLIAFRHGLRVSELISLRWDQVDLNQGLLHVRRLKNGTPSTHPLYGPELRALRRLQREYPHSSGYIFVGERQGPLTASTVRKVVARAGEGAKLGFPVHVHMLRHATGFYLANSGVDTRAIQHFLGHKNIQHTCLYTQLCPDRFKGFWKD
jgi:type 1 fimbriae regulatory protein FimE